jgi:peptidoglycan/LPS O-acetylase OafA/YrhL
VAPHLRALTSLRFFAAFHVVLYHNGGALLGGTPEAVRNVVDAGYVSVGLFFILSGFILTYVYVGARAELPPLRDFWVARVARIYPIFFVGLIAAIPFFVASQSPSLAPAGATPLSALVVLGLAQAWVPTMTLAWNGPGWSLSVEAFFYAVFPFLGGLFQERRTFGLVRLLALLWVASLAVPIAYLAIDPDGLGLSPAGWTGTWIEVVTKNPIARLPEFLIGVGLGYLFIRQRTSPAAALASRRAAGIAMGGALALLVGLSLHKAVPFPLVHNGLFAPLFALVIYGLAWERGWFARLLSTRPLVLLGEASYALYILHMPVWAWGLKFAPLLGIEGAQQSASWFVIYAVAVVGLAVAAYQFVERPARTRLRRRLTRAPRVEPVAERAAA